MDIAKWKANQHQRTWRDMSTNMRLWFLKVKRSRKGIKRASLPNTTYTALRRRGLVMTVGEWCMLTYPGDELFAWVKKTRPGRQVAAGAP
jgi:hypothetical protein